MFKHSVKININETDSISDQPITISVAGLRPLQKVTLHSHTTIDNGNSFECVAVYKSDHQGSINLSTDESIGGSYRGVEPMGLIWAMKESPMNKHAHARFVKMDITTPLVVMLNVYEELIFTLEELDSRRKNLKKLASTHIKRWFMAAGTKRITLTVEKHGIHGTLFIPPGQGPFPAVLTLFGSYPGTMEFKAALLSSYGFVTLALAFYGVPGLPSLESFHSWKVDLGYFEKAFEYLSNIQEVDDTKGFGVICISFSTQIMLAAASFLPKIRCVVWINGTIHTSYINLMYKGQEMPISQAHSEPGNFILNGVVKGRQLFLTFQDPFCPEAVAGLTDFYKRKGISYLFVVGLSDESLHSELWANQAEKLFKLAGHPSYKILRYPGAGHLIEPPYTPHIAVTAQKGQTVKMDWGGKTLPHCRAQEHSWIEQIKFLKENLLNQLFQGHKL
nr:bile acid-CoA:amino acid N-acyltransferase isoform X4 [Ciona intestinalis]|eukprot:XP_002129257.1 bile acid-CoA:amino acid N-acyltransferase isoform X4 [Ciona intestinalis]